MGLFSRALGIPDPPRNQEDDSDVPPSRRTPPDRAEKEALVTS